MKTRDWRMLEAIKRACQKQGAKDPLPWLELVPLRSKEQQALDNCRALPQAAFEALQDFGLLMPKAAAKLLETEPDDDAASGAPAGVLLSCQQCCHFASNQILALLHAHVHMACTPCLDLHVVDHAALRTGGVPAALVMPLRTGPSFAFVEYAKWVLQWVP